MKNKFLTLGFLAFAVVVACDNQQQQQGGGEQAAADTLVQHQFASAATLEEVWATDQVLEVPESVLYHAEEDILYVSNISGDPDEKNGNGFISKLSTEGEVVELKWVSGLHAPKGMGLMNGKLYVADIDVLVEIDVEKGEVSQRYAVEGASFLNDITVPDNARVLVSDSNEGRIYVLENGEVRVWNEEGLDRPNGLLADNGRILLASSGSGDVKEVSEDAVGDTLTVGIGHGDGLVIVDENNYLVSNWQGEVYLMDGNMEKVKLLDTKDQNINAADIEYIQDRNLLLVPTFRDNRVVAYRLDLGDVEE